MGAGSARSTRARRSDRGALLPGLICLYAPMLHAAGEAPELGPGTGLLQGLLGLVAVFAALAVFFWFLRRFSPGQTGAHGAVKVVGGVMLGPRERLVVVEVADTWLLLGVGAGQVRTLHTLPRPADHVDTPRETPSDFGAKLKALLARRPGA